MPWKMPLCVPCCVTRTATLSPSQITSSTNTRRSGNPERKPSAARFNPSVPRSGSCDPGKWRPKLGSISSSTTARFPLDSTSSIKRSTIALLSAPDIAILHRRGITTGPISTKTYGLIGNVSIVEPMSVTGHSCGCSFRMSSALPIASSIATRKTFAVGRNPQRGRLSIQLRQIRSRRAFAQHHSRPASKSRARTGQVMWPGNSSRREGRQLLQMARAESGRRAARMHSTQPGFRLSN
jgi:hypothetical protein